MKISILGWKYKNIRRMGDLEINLEGSNGEVFGNTLIMMPNGTGKTTTLKLICAALTGKAVEWKEREVRSFQPNYKNAKDGEFCLRVKFDEDLYYFILHFDYELGEVRYETSRAERSGGIESGHIIPLSLQGILTEAEFVNRFVFDGEQAQKTLDTGSSEAERAIVYLYQLDKMDNLSKEIDKLVARKQETANSQVTERSVKIYKTKADGRGKIYQDLKKKYENAKKELDSKRKKKKHLEERYQDIISKDVRMRDEQEELIERKRKIKNQIADTTEKIISFLQKPYNLQKEMDMRLQGLWQNMQTLRLPKNVAKEFFNELADDKYCVCGRCIGEKEKIKILENAKEYLGQEEFGVLNEIKSALKEYVVDDKELEQEKQRLKDLVNEEQDVENGLDRLATIMAEKGNQEILKIKATVEELENDIQRLEMECQKLNTKDYISNPELTAENNINKAFEAWQKAQAVYTKANGTYVFAKKAEKLKQYVQEVKEKSLQKLKKYIIQETNAKVQKIIKNDNVRIRNIIGHLIFEDRDNLSEGQNLAVAYAYIGTLFEHSQNEFPFIVDSPAAPLDLNMRREIAKIMPGLFRQMIVFVTSGEKEGFAETYFERDDVNYFTIDGKKDEAVSLHKGKDYFETFQGRGGNNSGV